MVELCHSEPVGGGSCLLRMVTIPPGCFMMGGMEDDKFVSEVELPAREVEVGRSFRMSECAVTRDQWVEVMGCLPSGNEEGLAGDVPVVCVGFADAVAFCRELGAGYRLPSEAEWEYACRGGSVTIFPHGSDVSPADGNYLYDELGFRVGEGGVVPVGRYGKNGFGLCDMMGNVCEWVMDTWHAGYRGAPGGAAAWVVGGKAGCRVIRGGGWDHLPRVLRSSWRDWAPEGARWDNLGFRVVEDF